VKTTFFGYSLVLSSVFFLSLLITTFFPYGTDARLIYDFFYFGILSLIFLLVLAFLANYNSRYWGKKLGKNIFLTLTTVSAISFASMSASYYVTGQVLRLQTILFTYNTRSIGEFTLVVLGSIVGVAALVLLLRMLFNFEYKSPRELRKLKILLIVLIIAFFILKMFISPQLNLRDPLVKSYVDGASFLIEPENLSSEKILGLETSLEDPNVIFILLESITNEKIGFYGYERDTTPNIDYLASKSIVFKNAYTTATHSDYAQPAYLSSNYLMENDYRTLFLESHDGEFPWDIFKREGYMTAYVSSQDDRWAGMGDYYNYDSLDLYRHSLSDSEYSYGTGLAKKDVDEDTMNDVLSWINETLLSCSPKKINQTYNVTCDVDPNKESFFVYTNLQATHRPYVYPSEFEYFKTEGSRDSIEEETDQYDNALRYVDYEIGRLVEYLESNNLSKNTLIIISADHGDDIYGRHDVSGHGLSIYNEELNVPLIFYLPDKEPRVINTPVSHVDVLPTVVEILGLSQSDSFRGSPFTIQNRIFFYAQNHKYLIGMVRDNIKIIVDMNRMLTEVYDLEADPLELEPLDREQLHNEYIIELLNWHYCQLNYFSAEEKEEKLETLCNSF
tara:strand:+ start:6616 stop:8466 length:1851 start_codon:yes stop_codon:yes gene_type:complete